MFSLMTCLSILATRSVLAIVLLPLPLRVTVSRCVVSKAASELLKWWCASALPTAFACDDWWTSKISVSSCVHEDRQVSATKPRSQFRRPAHRLPPPFFFIRLGSHRAGALAGKGRRKRKQEEVNHVFIAERIGKFQVDPGVRVFTLTHPRAPRRRAGSPHARPVPCPKAHLTNAKWSPGAAPETSAPCHDVTPCTTS